MLKPHPSKWFGQYVRQLIVGVNLVDGDSATLDALPDVVEARVNVFAPAMEDRILAELNCRLIVDVDVGDAGCSPVEAAKQPSQPDALARRCRGCDVFSFTRREGNHGLFL